MTKILLLSALILLVGDRAMAIDVFACEGRSQIMGPGKTMHMKMVLDEKSKEFVVTVNGIKTDEKVTLMTPRMDDLAAYLKCDAYDEPCKKTAHTDKDDGFEEAAGVIAFSKSMAKELPKTKQSSLAKIDINEVAKARIYQLGKMSKFGAMGVYEYFDKSEKMMGRFLYALETMDCRDKFSPTDDQAKMMRKLMESAAPAPTNGKTGR